jgi:hypothetical protein
VDLAYNGPDPESARGITQSDDASDVKVDDRTYADYEVTERPFPGTCPAQAKDRFGRFVGKVTFEFVVSPFGLVMPGTVIPVGAGYSRLQTAGEDFLLDRVFTPGRIRGTAVKTRTTMVIRFGP